MKKIALTIIFLIIVSNLFSDEAFFPTKPGMVQLIANLNSRGRVEGYNRMVIKDVRESGNDITVIYTIQILDRNRKPARQSSEREYSVTISNDVVLLRLANVMDAYFSTRNFNYTMTAGILSIPSNMAPGKKLDDTWMKMVVHVPVIGSVKADVAMTDIVCAGIETVTVPAGTFEAFKLTQTTTSVTEGYGSSKPIINTGEIWYVKGIGEVKSISYDAKGKVESSTELYELQ